MILDLPFATTVQVGQPFPPELVVVHHARLQTVQKRLQVWDARCDYAQVFRYEGIQRRWPGFQGQVVA